MKVLKFLNRILPLFFWVFMIFSFDSITFGVMTLLAAVIHELGHFAFGIFAGRLTIFPHPTGLRIKAFSTSSYKTEALLVGGGPIFSLLAAFIFFMLSRLGIFSDYFSLFSAVNLFTGLSNLMPIEGYDGYKICECIFFLYSKSTEKAYKTLFLFSFYFTYALMLFALYLILKIGEGYWIFGVMLSSFVLSLKKLIQNNISRE